MINIIYSVKQINNRINSFLNNDFSNIWIKGQITNIKEYSSGHAYFILKDNNAELSCVFFNYSNFISKKTINENIEIVAYGSLSIYISKGKYQFIVENIHRSGESELWLKYQLLKNKLEKKGFFNKKNKTNILPVNENIALITSLKGAVINDMLNIFKRRAPYVNLFIYDVAIQGKTTASKIVEIINRINKKLFIDLIIIARGGGKYEDFSPFNEEILLSSIFDSNISILTAIGHETDVCLADYVADKYVSTPSEAAEICTLSKNEIHNIIYNKLNIIYQNLLQRFSEDINFLEKKYHHIDLKNPIILISELKQLLQLKLKNLHKLVNHKLELYKRKSLILKTLIPSLDINRIKNRGFAIIKKNNNIVVSEKEIFIDDMISIELSNTSVISRVIKKENNEKK